MSLNNISGQNRELTTKVKDSLEIQEREKKEENTFVYNKTQH